ncbi:MAG: hypothetical protein E6J85_20745 [Deltaproteobacteria bacterium]|nr:MAG: hypothetical protein E6J85_20745 [Deltaproteobacteria bacterium]
MRARCMALCVLLGACGPPTQTSGSYSFEGSLQGWTPAALDVAPAAPAGGWSIIASTDQSYAGVWSARVFLDNETDAGKVWIARTWRLAPFRSYDLHIEFALGTSDADPAGSFRILAGAATTLPANGDEAISLARDDTANGGSTSVEWLFKRYDSVVETDRTGELTTVVGIWGTSGGTRTYYLDTLAVEFTERP